MAQSKGVCKWDWVDNLELYKKFFAIKYIILNKLKFI